MKNGTLNLKKVIRCILALGLVLGSAIAAPLAQAKFNVSENLGRTSLMIYGGQTANEVFGSVIGGNFHSFGERSFTIETSHAFSESSGIHRLFYPISDMVQLAANYTYRQDYRRHDHVHECNLFFIWSFRRFPWSNALRTTLSFGDGISLSSHVPNADRGNKEDDEVSRFLNYMIVELALALPSQPQAQLVFRVHHKCTAFGLFPKRASAGSTGVGIGFRWFFE